MYRYARKCDATGRGMNDGFVVGAGDLHFSEKQHLIDWLRGRGGMDGLSDEFILNEAYEQEEYYYTEWEEIDDDVYYDEDGNELKPMIILNLQSEETIDQNGIIYYLTGEYAYMGKIENGNTRVLLDQNDGKFYLIEMTERKINSLIN